MQIKHVTYLVLITVFLSSFSLSQDNERVEASKLFVKSYFRLPIVTSNDFFTQSSRGISDIGLSFNYEFFKGLNIGAGFKHSFFEISQFKITENIDAKTHVYGAYAELSYIKYLSSKVFVDFSVQGGLHVLSSSSNAIRTSGLDFIRTRGNYLSPNIGFYLVGPERVCYSFTVGYTMTQTSITPETYGLDNFKDFTIDDYIGNLQHVNFGFGILVNIGKLNSIDTE